MSSTNQEPNIEVIKLPSRPTEEEVDAAAGIILDAFRNDVIVTAMAGWNPKAMELLMRYRVREGSPEWDTYVAKVDGKIQGVALCIPAGQAHPPNPENFTSLLDKETLEWQRDVFYKSMNKLDDLSFGPNGQERSLYLNFLAVSPDSRKLGLGGKLINHVKAVADGQKVDLTLNAEHEHLVRFYTKRGLKVTGQADITVDKQGKQIPSWGLVSPYKQ